MQYDDLTIQEQRAVDAAFSALFDSLGKTQSDVADKITFAAETAIIKLVTSMTRDPTAGPVDPWRDGFYRAPQWTGR